MDMPLSAFHDISRTKPLSITARTSLIVTEDSAIFVAKITFTTPSGAGMKTFCCSSCGIVECKGMTLIFWNSSGSDVSSNTAIAALISSHPGKKHKILPFLPASVSTVATCLATCATSCTVISLTSFSELAPLRLVNAPVRMEDSPVRASRRATARRSARTRDEARIWRGDMPLRPTAPSISIAKSSLSSLMSSSSSSSSSSSETSTSTCSSSAAARRSICCAAISSASASSSSRCNALS
mmetsp:Transcript_1428/g.3155  ORF Transcript_1428/g.3155 Transcript_1428/m.3155 type:complete len:240 (-) Transcript_1428:575-1294(-)